MTIKQFYKHFGRLYAIALRSNPLRVNKIKVRFKDFFRAVIFGTKYVFSLYNIYKDYPKTMHSLKNEELVIAAKKEGFFHEES